MQADVGESPRLDQRQRLGHAVDERFAADEAQRGPARASAAKCSPPPKPISRPTSSSGECANSVASPAGGAARSSASRGSRLAHQGGLMRPQRMTLAPAEEGAAACLVAGFARAGHSHPDQPMPYEPVS